MLTLNLDFSVLFVYLGYPTAQSLGNKSFVKHLPSSTLHKDKKDANFHIFITLCEVNLYHFTNKPALRLKAD